MPGCWRTTAMSPRLDQGIPKTAADAVVPEQLRPDHAPEPASPEEVHEIFDQLDLPEIPPYDEVGPVDARAMSKTLFRRLETLEEGTHEFAYVRNTLVELNLALVKFAASRFRS